MSTPIKKLNIRDAIKSCGYNQNIKQEFVNFLENNYSNPKNKLYLFSRNENSQKLFILNLQIPTKFNNNSYDISLLIYFPLNFPAIPPEIYFQKLCSVKLNPKIKYSDEETLKINYNLFFNWENSFDSFKKLINEIYRQFNINFPIFTQPNSKENLSKEGDCVLKISLCKEIELSKPKNNIQNKKPQIQQNKNTNKNNVVKRTKTANYSLNNNVHNNLNNTNNNKNNHIANQINIKSNEQGKNLKSNNNFNGNVKNNMNNNINRKNYTNNNNCSFNPIPGKINEEEEKMAKAAMVELLCRELSNKIGYIFNEIDNSNNKLLNIKENINEELKELDTLEKKQNNIEKTINTVQNEINDSVVLTPEKIDRTKIDFSDLSSILTIKNIDKYAALSKERAIEEYILVIKKSYEKKNIKLATAINEIRTNSRNIFFLKYKIKKLSNK